MEWREQGGARWLQASLPGAGVAFSSRSCGDMREGHAAFATALGLPSERVAIARQVHGAELAVHGAAGPTGRPEADGHVIAAPGQAALIFVADCLPVALSGAEGAAILHCGWRGMAAGVIGRGAAAVGARAAAIGPGIGPCCYEVGEEVLAAFPGLGEGIADGRMLDLIEVARRLLREAGVERVEAAGLCTSCEAELFFSHRRDGDRAGRQAGLIWLEGEG